MAGHVFTDQLTDLFASAGRTTAGEQLVGNCGQREHVGGCSPFAAHDSLGRAVWPSHRRADTHSLERFDNPESTGAGFIRGHEHIAQVETAVYSTGNREVTLRNSEFRGALDLVAAMLAARQAA